MDYAEAYDRMEATRDDLLQEGLAEYIGNSDFGVYDTGTLELSVRPNYPDFYGGESFVAVDERIQSLTESNGGEVFDVGPVTSLMWDYDFSTRDPEHQRESRLWAEATQEQYDFPNLEVLAEWYEDIGREDDAEFLRDRMR